MDMDMDIKTIEVQMPRLGSVAKAVKGTRIVAKNETGIRKACSNWAQDIEQSPEEQLNVLECGMPVLQKALMRQQIAAKISGYRAQDQEKGIYDEAGFINIDIVCAEIIKCGGRCYYCSKGVKILYTEVRDRQQWTVDRIYNNRGHNCDNFVIACLGCNLHRRCRNAEEFNTTSNMVVIKLGDTSTTTTTPNKAHLDYC